MLVDLWIHPHLYYTQIHKSDILIQPLLNDTRTQLNGESTSTAPIFYDPTPLSPQTAVTQFTQNCHATGADNSHTQSQTEFKSRPTPPPNQPVAEVIGGLQVPPNKQQCPTCQTVFTMLGKREFQSHMAGCRKPS